MDQFKDEDEINLREFREEKIQECLDQIKKANRNEVYRQKVIDGLQVLQRLI